MALFNLCRHTKMSGGQWSRTENSVKNCILGKIINATYLRAVGQLDTLRLTTSRCLANSLQCWRHRHMLHNARSALSCCAFRFRPRQHYFDNNCLARHAQASDTLTYLGNEQRFTDFSDWFTLTLAFLPAHRRYFALAKIAGRLSFAIVADQPPDRSPGYAKNRSFFDHP